MPMANCRDRISVNQKLHVSLVTCLVFIQQVFKPLYCSLFTIYLKNNKKIMAIIMGVHGILFKFLWKLGHNGAMA